MNAATIASFLAALALVISLGLAMQVAGLRRRLAAVHKDGNVIDLMRTIDHDLGEVEKQVNLVVIGDDIVEGDEKFGLTLTRPSPAAITLEQPSRVTILNNNG